MAELQLQSHYSSTVLEKCILLLKRVSNIANVRRRLPRLIVKKGH